MCQHNVDDRGGTSEEAKNEEWGLPLTPVLPSTGGCLEAAWLPVHAPNSTR
jgi:hypothetical protein